MGFRFRKSVKLFPGLRVNFSTSSASVSVGPRGLRYTVGSKGTRVTAGIPGTGLSWTEYAPHAKQQSFRPTNANQVVQEANALTAIYSAPPNQLNELSTSELAPILHSAQRRIRFAPLVLMVCVLLFATALLSANQLLIGLSALYAAIFVPLANFLDRYRRSVKIDYKLDDTANKIAAALADSFADLSACARPTIMVPLPRPRPKSTIQN